LVSAAAQSEVWTEPKGSAQAEPKVRIKPQLRPNDKFDHFLAHLQLRLEPKGSATDSAKRWSHPM